MKFRSCNLFLAILIFCVTSFAEDPWSDATIERRVENILISMTLEQKVGQMVQGDIDHVTPSEVAKFHLGSVLNGGGHWPAGKYSSVADWLSLADAYHRASLDKSLGGAGIPIIWGTDAVHGHNNVMGSTIFPHNIGLGATGDPELIQRIGEATAVEIAMAGQDWNFAPTLAVAKDRRWGRSYQSFSDDAEMVKLYAEAMIKGLQGTPEQLYTLPWKLVATAKNFIGDGGTFRGIDQGDTRLDIETMLELHGKGYVAAIDAGVQTIMVSFNSWNGKKLHGQKSVLTDLLKNKLGFDGFVIGDWNGHGQVPGCSNDSCPQAINAGIDMLMAPKDWKPLITNILREVQSGEIPESRINDAVRRILRVKLRSGIFSRGLPSERFGTGSRDMLGGSKHRGLARDAVRKSLVLLKNKNSILPIQFAQKVLIGGDGAHNIGKQTGGWTLTRQGNDNANDDFPGATSIYTGLKRAIELIGGSVELAVNDNWEIKPDVAVVVFGEEPYAEGQGDLDSLMFKDSFESNLNLMLKLQSENIPMVSVFLTGRPLFINSIIDQSEAFVVAWLPGSEGRGIADVLVTDRSGRPRFDFTGKLPFPWPDEATNKYHPDLPAAGILFNRGYGLSYSKDNKNITNDLSEEGSSEIATESRVIFKGRSVFPFQSYVGDTRNWSFLVSGAQTSSLQKGVSVNRVDRIDQEDSWQVEWSGLAGAQFYWRTQSPIDLTKLVDNNAAIVSTFKVDRAPEGNVKQRMDCGYPCGGEIDMTAFFRMVPEEKWVRAGIPLSCFAKAGVDLTRVTSPMLLFASDPFAITFRDLRIIPNPPESVLMGCL